MTLVWRLQSDLFPMKALNRKIKFKKGINEYFHLNFDYIVSENFPELDWLLVNYKLNKMAKEHKIEMHAFVMMSTHCHLLFKTHLQNENYFTDAILKELNIDICDESLVEPIQNLSQYLNSYKYIYRNPVMAGLVKRCEDYRFSSLHGLLGQSILQTQVIDPLSIAQNVLHMLDWLNDNYQKKLFHFNSADT